MKAFRKAMILGVLIFSLGPIRAQAIPSLTFQESQEAAAAEAFASRDVPQVYAIGSAVQLKGAPAGAKGLYEIRGYGPSGELIVNNTSEYATRLTVLQSDVLLPVAEANGYRPGDRVFTNYSGNVRIQSIFPDGTVIAAGVDRGFYGKTNGSFWKMNPNEYTAAPTFAERMNELLTARPARLKAPTQTLNPNACADTF